MHNNDVTSGYTPPPLGPQVLLVAAPLLDDPNFDRTVVLLLQHSDVGALGVVINRPTDEDALVGLEPWLAASAAPQVVFEGGPVAADTLIALAQVPAGTEAEGLGALWSDLASVDLTRPPGEVLINTTRLRLFRGYSGWAPGQLEAEIDSGSWIVIEAKTDDAFSTNPQGIWRNVLRREGGPKAVLADAPDNLSWN